MVPWTALITGASAIASAAGALFGRMGRRGTGQQSSNPNVDTDTISRLGTEVTDIKDRLVTVEIEAREQAELISRMATQEEAILRGLEALSTRMSFIYWALAGTIAVAIAALLVALLIPR